MKSKHLRKNLHERIYAACAAVLFTTAAATTGADALYLITGAEESAIVLQEGRAAADYSSQLINVTARQRGGEVNLSPDQTVTIRHNGAFLAVQSQGETVSALLDRLHIQPSPIEMVAVDVSSGVNITIASDVTYYETVAETTGYPTVRIPDPTMAKGTEKVVQQGQDGISTNIYEVVWSNGSELSRQFVRQVHTTTVEEIVRYGTDVDFVPQDDALVQVTENQDGSGTLHFASGDTMTFSQARDMTATAYTAGHGGADTCTATGTTVRTGVVAVDKRVIPLGTRMYIVTKSGIIYGTAVAEDTGVRGEKVDLYYNTYDECIQFGRRSCTVYILE